MFINHCETCIHWEQLFDENLGICQNVKIAQAPNEVEDNPELRIISTGVLLTRFNFGCNSHVTKSSPIKCPHFLDRQNL